MSVPATRHDSVPDTNVDDGPQWEVIRLPAIADSEGDALGRQIGEALCRERYDEQALAETKRDVGSYVWSALYQQAPTPAAGNLFKRVWFRTFTVPTPGIYALAGGEQVEPRLVKQSECQRFQTCDLAASEKQSADYTVICTWDLTRRNELLLVDVVRAHIGPGEILKVLVREYVRMAPLYLAVEEAFYGMYAIADLRKAGVAVRKLKADTDKVVRAIPAGARVEVGDVYWQADAPWRPEWEKELLTFPNGSHDDQVDNLSYAVRRIDRTRPLESGERIF